MIKTIITDGSTFLATEDGQSVRKFTTRFSAVVTNTALCAAGHKAELVPGTFYKIRILELVPSQDAIYGN